MTARRRLALGLAGVAATAAVVRQDRVGRRELRAFRLVNDLPDGLFQPLWVVMQGGALGATPAAAAVAWRAGQPRLARRLLVSGTVAWVAAKAVKGVVRRPRPLVLVPTTRSRGREASGLGYLSGHAAVSAALVSAALPHLSGRARAAALAGPAAVSVARLHTGAHLPLDVVAGAALGVAVDAAVALAGTAWHRQQEGAPPDWRTVTGTAEPGRSHAGGSGSLASAAGSAAPAGSCPGGGPP